MNFAESVNYLYSLGHETLAMKFGLRNTETLLNSLNNPHQSYLKIQIAGTNGKGSVAAFLDAICRAAHIKTGLFTSPHLVSITERIKLAGIEITQSQFAELTSEVKQTAKTLVAAKTLAALPTFFEHLTAIGLLAFEREKVDLAILETGLGGRLDSTTAARAEIACLTMIDFDHQEYLGNTIEQIAAEKAAIIHPGSRVIVSNQKPEVLKVIAKRCAEVGVEPIVDACRFEIEGATDDGKMIATFRTETRIYPRVCLSLRGRHQLENAATAIVLAESLTEFPLNQAAIIKGLETAQHAGRLDRRGNILFDGAHNVAGAKALNEFLSEFNKKLLTLVFGAMRDKDLEQIASLLFPLADKLIFTRASNPRSATPEALLDFVPQNFPKNNIFLVDIAAEAIKKARQITAPEDLICVTGSLYLIGEIEGFINRI